MGYALRDHRRHTYADYRTWPEDVRYELIDGAAFLKAPAPSVDHRTLAFEVRHQLGNALEGKPSRVLLAPVDVLLAAPGQGDEEIDTVVQPDVLAVCERAGVREYWLAHPTDRVLTIYRHDGAAYGRPEVVELAGETLVGVLPGTTVRWAPIVARLLTD